MHRREFIAMADEAIKVASERHARIPECLARIVRADLLLRSPAQDRIAEGRQEIAHSRVLMRETGALLFSRFIDEVDIAHPDDRQGPDERKAIS